MHGEITDPALLMVDKRRYLKKLSIAIIDSLCQICDNKHIPKYKTIIVFKVIYYMGRADHVETYIWKFTSF